MKKLSKLTALLLAFVMLFGMMPVSALATTISMADYQTAKENSAEVVQQQLQTTTTVETVNSTAAVTTTSNLIVRSEESADVTTLQDGDSVSLPIAGKLNLSADAADAWQWQVYVSGVWANIAEETAADVTLTYPMLANAMSGNTAQVRCRLTNGEEVSYSAAVNVVLDETVQTTPVTTTENVAVTADMVKTSRNLNGGIMLLADYQTYYITVNYVFENNEQAAYPHTAQVGEVNNTASYVQKVKMPEIQGYQVDTARLATELEKTNGTVTYDAANGLLDFNIESLNADLTLTVIYAPAEVSYTVKYFKQNTTDDGYTEAETVTMKGLTGSLISSELAPKNKYEGFSPLVYETGTTIAANGSTVINIYYDRLYYLMTFDLGGGTGVEPIYARFGSPVIIGNPTRAGYLFAGWDKAVPTTVPAADTKYVATWNTGTANYSVVYWFENADSTDANDPDNYSAVHVISGNSAQTESPLTSDAQADISDLDTTVVNGLNEAPKHFTRYTGTEAASGGSLKSNYTVAGDGSTIVNVYYTRRTYTIRFFYAMTNPYGYVELHTQSSGPSMNPNAWATPGRNYMTLPTVQSKYQSGLGELTVRINQQNYTFHYYDLTAKYNSDIADKWPDDLFGYNSSTNSYHNYIQNSWFIHSEAPYYDTLTGTNRTFKGTYTRLDDLMIIEGYDDNYLDAENGIINYFIGFWRDRSSSYTYYIFYEVIDGDTLPEDAVIEEHNGKKYVLQLTMSAISGSGDSGQHGPGFGGVVDVTRNETGGAYVVAGGSGTASDPRRIYFFYDRLNYNLTYLNNGTVERVDSVPYGAQMGRYSAFVPTNAPDEFHIFDGWYSDEACITPYVFASENMPMNNVTLYAKWVPVSHNVKVYLDEASIGTTTGLLHDLNVQHGSFVQETITPPDNKPYEFVYWFYKDANGVEKAFDFKSMPVNQDLVIYGKWSANVLMPYTVYYIEQGTGNSIGEATVYVADLTSGSGLVGTTKTFEAKGGTQLYSTHQTGWFPTTKSHSFVIDIEGENTYSFEYVKKDAVPYKVLYLDAATKQPVDAEKYPAKIVDGNQLAVVTENFLNISGYVPDAFQKRLVVEANGTANDANNNGEVDAGENLIIFYYTKDETRTTYEVKHYLVDANSTTREYSSTQEIVTLPYNYNETALTITNYTYDPDRTTRQDGEAAPVHVDSLSGTIAAGTNGVVLSLYYVEDEVTINYQVSSGCTGFGTVDPASETIGVVTGSAAGSTAAANEGYTFEGWYQDPECTIQVGSNAAFVPSKNSSGLNVAATYYAKFKENDATLNYVVVGPDGCGTVDPASETVKVVSGVALGSTATPSGNAYKFVGWYSDATCETKVAEAWVDENNKITPTKTANDVWEDGTTYYAKFDWNVTDLTIVKNGLTGTDSAIFEVTGTNIEGEQTWYISLANGQSAVIADMLIYSDYTITEQTDWTKYYNPISPITGEVQPPDSPENTVTITNTPKSDKWLHDESYEVNFDD